MYFIFQDHEAVEYLAKMSMSSDSKSSAFLVIELEILALLNKPSVPGLGFRIQGLDENWGTVNFDSSRRLFVRRQRNFRTHHGEVIC